MVSGSILNYLREGLKEGHSLEMLKQELLKSGWNPAEVNEAANMVQAQPAPPSPLPESKPEAQQAGKRPAGMTIICVLGFLLSVLLIITGIIALSFSGLVSGMDMIAVGNARMSVPGGLFGSLFVMLGLVSLIIGIVGLIAFYLLLKMKKTGLIIVLVIGIITIFQSIINIIQFPLISIINSNIWVLVVWIIIVAYLLMKRRLFV